MGQKRKYGLKDYFEPKIVDKLKKRECIEEKQANFENQTEEKTKRNKINKKKKKKIRKLKVINQEKNLKVKKAKLIAYLNDWNNRANCDWKFNKSYQTWLFKNWALSDFLKDQDFNLFLQYSSGLTETSQARSKLIEEANKLIENDQVDETLINRSRSLIQMLV